MKSTCRQHEIVIHTYPKNIEYLVISGAQNKVEEFDTKDEETVALPIDEDSFYRLEHQEEDLINKKVESLLVRLQRVSDAIHLDDYSINNKKERVAKEKEMAARKMGHGIRLLPKTKEDVAEGELS
uniref:Putative CWC16 protein n=1 Tax=Helianthus annuus TaxID=4232 RepID=A0A251SI27_HELAN